MKSRTVVGIGLAVGLVVGASTAVAWDDANRTVSKLGVETIENPSGATVTVNDNLTVNGTLSGTITNFTGNGVNVTNLQGGNIAAGNVALARVTNAFATATAIGNATTALDGEGSSVTNLNGANIATGNIPVARLTNAFVVTLQPAYASGDFRIANTTQLVFFASGVTNLIDADITTP